MDNLPILVTGSLNAFQSGEDGYCFKHNCILTDGGEVREMVEMETAVDALVRLAQGPGGCDLIAPCPANGVCGSPACRSALRAHLREEAIDRG